MVSGGNMWLEVAMVFAMLVFVVGGATGVVMCLDEGKRWYMHAVAWVMLVGGMVACCLVLEGGAVMILIVFAVVGVIYGIMNFFVECG
jgi:hypothetical protein